LNATRYEIEKFKTCDIRLISIPGNHDYADRNGNIHALSIFNNIVVSDEVQLIFGSGGEAIITVPYTDDIALAKEYLKKAGELASKEEIVILLAHLGMQGAKVGSDYVLVHDSDISVDDVPYDNFTACLFGHFHQHQQLFKNGWYIGASHQHNWGDVNTKRGFLHCKIDDAGKFSFDFIETQSARKFHRLSTVELASKKSEIRPFDHVAITDVPSMSMARRLEIQLGLETSIVLASEEIEETDDSDMKLPSLNLKDYVGKWVQYKLNKDNKELENLGMSILSEAIQEKI
jgi:DNA repair exonuclease SbcCD nuclease subunit